MAENNFEFKLINLSDKLKEYIDPTTKISLSNLADAYLRISIIIYKLLRDYHSKKDKLSDGYKELLELINRIQKKDTKPSDDKVKNSRDRISIWENKSAMISSIGMYVTEMQNLRQNNMSKIAIIISISVPVASVFTSFFLRYIPV